MAENQKSRTKAQVKPKLTDAERHKRFVDMAHEVEANEAPEEFDKAFRKIATAGSAVKCSR
jgi:hypothetical protein